MENFSRGITATATTTVTSDNNDGDGSKNQLQEEEEEVVVVVVVNDDNNLSCPQRCARKIVTYLSFWLTTISGLSLLTSGFFLDLPMLIDDVNSNSGPIASASTTKLTADKTINNNNNSRGLNFYFDINVHVIIGVLIVVYATVGLCMNCFNKLYGRVS